MSHGCFCTLLFIFCCHIVLFVSELLPCLTFCLPSSSCAMNNCYSMPWGFPSPICLKSLACCYLHWVTSIATWPSPHIAVLSEEKKQKVCFYFTEFPVCEPGSLQHLSLEWTASLIDSPSQFEILFEEGERNFSFELRNSVVRSSQALVVGFMSQRLADNNTAVK